MPKICTTCSDSTRDTILIENSPQVADWIKKMDNVSNIPTDYLPEIKDLRSYAITPFLI